MPSSDLFVRWGLANFCLGWPQTKVLMSASQVARVTGVSHNNQPGCFFLTSGLPSVPWAG
jgi:hypothetical protein